MPMNKMHKGEIAFHLMVPFVMVVMTAAIGYYAVKIAMLSMDILKIV